MLTGTATSAVFPGIAFARRFLSVEEAQQIMFPDGTLTRVPVELDPEQARAIEERSGVPVRVRLLSAWRAAGGGWCLVDEVIGKHEYITWALALGGDGQILGVEILEYRETYGGEVRNERWRKQFLGRTSSSLPVFGADIRNISGATLSCTHLTEGVRRLLATYDLVLKHLPSG